jgi:hypothetical protein
MDMHESPSDMGLVVTRLTDCSKNSKFAGRPKKGKCQEAKKSRVRGHAQISSLDYFADAADRHFEAACEAWRRTLHFRDYVCGVNGSGEVKTVCSRSCKFFRHAGSSFRQATTKQRMKQSSYLSMSMRVLHDSRKSCSEIIFLSKLLNYVAT